MATDHNMIIYGTSAISIAKKNHIVIIQSRAVEMIFDQIGQIPLANPTGESACQLPK